MIASVGLYGLLSSPWRSAPARSACALLSARRRPTFSRLVSPRALAVSRLGLTAGGSARMVCRPLASSLHLGVQAHDGLTFTAVVVVLAAASFLAAWLPARRAAAVDPILALRSE